MLRIQISVYLRRRYLSMTQVNYDFRLDFCPASVVRRPLPTVIHGFKTDVIQYSRNITLWHVWPNEFVKCCQNDHVGETKVHLTKMWNRSKAGVLIKQAGCLVNRLKSQYTIRISQSVDNLCSNQSFAWTSRFLISLFRWRYKTCPLDI